MTVTARGIAVAVPTAAWRRRWSVREDRGFPRGCLPPVDGPARAVTALGDLLHLGGGPRDLDRVGEARRRDRHDADRHRDERQVVLDAATVGADDAAASPIVRVIHGRDDLAEAADDPPRRL